MSRRPKWNGASAEAKQFKQRVICSEIRLDSQPKAVWEANQDILGKYSVKQVENAMLRFGETELGKIILARNTQGKVDCYFSIL